MESKNTTLFSIGHGHKSKDIFISELKQFGIKFLIDVRSNPYSKWSPDYNQGVIEEWLKQAGVRYVYMGNQIGGKPVNDECYDEEGYFDYHKMSEMPQFKAGLKRLLIAYEKKLPVAIMCSETDPSTCHRSKLIGRELYFKHHINLLHILNHDMLVSQEDIMMNLTKETWLPHGDLFGECTPPYFRSCKPYRGIAQEEEEYYD